MAHLLQTPLFVINPMRFDQGPMAYRQPLSSTHRVIQCIEIEVSSVAF